MSGVDMALWDIKGKLAGMPVYQLSAASAGARRRSMSTPPAGIATKSRRTSGASWSRVSRYIRCQVAVPGYVDLRRRTVARTARRPHPRHLRSCAGRPWDPRAYCRIVPKLFEHLRTQLGDEVELLHDIHERVPPIMAISLAKELEQYKLFFLEDPFAPEDNGYFPLLRQQTSIPIAMGELYVNQAEYVPLIKDRLIDFIRVHISDIGGLTPARKLAAFCEFFGVRTAWHGPGDVSPVGHAANLAARPRLPQLRHPGGAPLRRADAARSSPATPEIRDGMMWSNEQPGPRHRHRRSSWPRNIPSPSTRSTAPGRRCGSATAPCSGHESAQQNADKFRACARASSAFACRPLSESLPSAFGLE